MAESAMDRTQTIIELLKKEYPHAKIILRYRNPWELLVAVILSAQCTDVVVNTVTAKLFDKYKTLDDYVKAEVNEFEQDIKSTGFYHNKAKNILAAAKLVKDHFDGHVPDSMEKLLTLPGVARKTANVVLGNAFGIVEGIAVDTHVLRLSQRLRLVDLDKIGGKKKVVFKKNIFTRPRLASQGEALRKFQNGLAVLDYKKDADPHKIEKELMKALPKSEWFPITYLLIDHGRAVCKAQNPHCSVCVLRRLCNASRA